MPTLTEAGYVGEDVKAISRNCTKVVTEVDRAGNCLYRQMTRSRANQSNHPITHDNVGQSVQQALLKLMSTMASGATARWTQASNQILQVEITTNILFICGFFRS
jgi:ATP-dependent protease Clp ATPase subunit